MIEEVSRPKIAVLDYGIGNLRSAQKALDVSGANAVLTDDADTITAADGVVLPGVGAFGACMNALRRSRLDSLVHDVIEADTPFMGICVGMQMLFDGSDESPDVAGLGIMPGRIRWLSDSVKRPQMQWNRIAVSKPDLDGAGEMTRALLDGLDGQWTYFVHSLSAEPTACTVATVDYGGPVTAAVARQRVFATQFHPEKSATAGLNLLARFVNFCSTATRSENSTSTI